MRGGAPLAVVLAGLGGLLVADAYSASQVYRLSQTRATIRGRYADVNGIDHGVLSVDAWMGHLRHIVVHQVEHFSLTDEERRNLHTQLERGLNGLLDRLEQMHPDTLKGKLGKAAVGVLVPRRAVPGLVDDILAQASRPDTRHAIEHLAVEKLDEYAAQTRDIATSRNELAVYYRLYHVDNRADFNRVTTARAEALRRQVRVHCGVLIASLVLVVALWAFVGHRRELRAVQRPVFAVSVVVALITLVAGLSSPMIEIDARIRRIDFLLLGEHLRFDNQVLYYQSKSILQVVRTLLATHAPDSIFVGVLILLFSVLLPTAKLIATELVLLGGPRLQKSAFLRVVAFKTGKWSMADVLVVAIFMAYVGFRAVLDSQLQGLNLSTPSLSTITTNQTSLQPAFMLFTSFVLFGLVLAELIKRHAASAARPVSSTST